MAVGMITDTRAGRNSLATSRPEVTLPRIQSMMVVTSPMGEKAPPLLAAMTITLAKIHRSFCPLIIRRSSMIIMIVVVMLSSTADIKKVMIDSNQSSLRLLRVLMWSVMTWNPPCRSISSTMVMAPIRKKRISLVSPSCSISCVPIWASLPSRLNTVHNAPHISRAIAALSMRNLCSSAMQRYPNTKIRIMVIIISYCIELSILSMESKRRNPCAVVRVSGDLDPNLPLSVEFFLLPRPFAEDFF